MSEWAKCFASRLRIVGSHARKSSDRFSRCARSFSRTLSSKTSPTRSKSKFFALCALFVLSAGASPAIKRWSLAGDPRGIAIGADGTVYVGLAQSQAVVALDPTTGAIKRKIVLDSADIASTKELVSLRTDAAKKRLFIANGSDESVTILSLPDLAVIREITIEGEAIRDALPDPGGKFLYLLGRRVHVYDSSGKNELRVLPVDDPSAIAANPSVIAIFHATGLTRYETAKFTDIGQQRLDGPAEAAVFAGETLIAITRKHIYEISRSGIIRDDICLPDRSGPQIAVLASPKLMLYAERACTMGAFSTAPRQVTPASLYGVEAYALAVNGGLVYATDRKGYVTVYRAPR